MYIYIFIYVCVYIYIYVYTYLSHHQNESIKKSIDSSRIPITPNKKHRAATSLRSCIRVFCSSAPLKACRRASTIFSKPSWQLGCYPWGKTLEKTMAPWLFETGKTTKNYGAMASIWLPYHISILVYCKVQQLGKQHGIGPSKLGGQDGGWWTLKLGSAPKTMERWWALISSRKLTWLAG